jgi:hypothetical protein
MKMLNLNELNNVQLIAFIRMYMHPEKYADQLCGTNPVERKTINQAKKILKTRNMEAFKKDLINRRSK